jgi:hypothetical protein
MFGLVSHFRVFRGHNGQSQTQEFETLAEAIAAAKSDDHAILYAVSVQGHTCILPRKEWS